MASVTQRIKEIKQPRGGYLKPSRFSTTILNKDSKILICSEMSSITVGLVVDYMTRFRLDKKINSNTNAMRIFEISLKGASYLSEEMYNYAVNLVKIIEQDNTDFETINACCKLVTFDSMYRAGIWKESYLVDVSEEDAEIILKMVNRSVSFFEKYGPIIESGMTFKGGYTKIVSSGDADFLTKDTLWDFKVSKNKILNRYTLQIYMYYLMGVNSIYSDMYKSLKYIGFYNPSRNEVTRMEIKDIEEEIKDAVLFDVIGYERDMIK